MKILITNIVSLNVGDAAILQGMFITLKDKYGKDTEILVYDAKSEAAQALYPWAKFKKAVFYIPCNSLLRSFLGKINRSYKYDQIRLLRLSIAGYFLKKKSLLIASIFSNKQEQSALLDYLDADLVVSTGGTYLIENYDLKKNILDYILTLNLGTKLGFYTQTIGKLKTPYYLKSFRKIFKNSEFVFLRDSTSKNNVIFNGEYDGRNIYILPDAAFTLSENIEKHKNTIRRVAISVRELKYFDEQGNDKFFKEIAKLCEKLIQRNISISFISTCQGIPEYWTDDSRVAETVKSYISDKFHSNIEINHEFHQPDEIISIYSSFDLVIATRMHAAILSLCAGTPTLGLAYEYKIEELYRSLGFPELAIKTSNVTANHILKLIDSLDDEKISSLINSVANLTAKASKATEYLPS